MADITQIEQVLEAVKAASGPVTSYQIRKITGLTSRQVNLACWKLKRQGKIRPERSINIQVKAFNRWQHEPQRWQVAGENDRTND